MGTSEKHAIRVASITNKKVWEAFLSSCNEKTFLHSWNWGEFNARNGDRIFRFGVYDGNTLLAVFLIIKVMAKRGCFLFCPHGPIVKHDIASVLPHILSHLRELGRKENVSFLRISPLLSPHDVVYFRQSDFRDAPIHMMHPELTWQLDITPSEEELLMGMRKTTRYLVRRAPKDGVSIEMRRDIDSVFELASLLEKTAERQRFVPFSSQYLENEFSAFIEDDQIVVFLGKYDGKVISAAMIVFYDGVAYYHHGASLSEFQKIPASYLIQWEAILEAKRRGFQRYNFWGVVSDEKHPWFGLSLFKRGFGGYETAYAHAQDLVLKPNYWLTYLIETLRRKKRGL